MKGLELIDKARTSEEIDDVLTQIGVLNDAQKRYEFLAREYGLKAVFHARDYKETPEDKYFLIKESLLSFRQ